MKICCEGRPVFTEQSLLVRSEGHLGDSLQKLGEVSMIRSE